MKEGEGARRALADQRRRTTARRDLARAPGFAEVSPAVGALDEAAFDRRLSEDPDAALTLLADLTGAADPALRALARRLAGRVVLSFGRSGAATGSGIGRLVRRPLVPGRDLDVDASVGALAEAAGTGVPPSTDELVARGWARPRTALCLVVDRSGSMGGARLASAALAASAVAHRAPDDHSVLAFAADVVVVKAQDAARPPDAVVDDLLTLRGHGPTNLALALREARTQLARSTAPRRRVILLSDCRPTAGADPVAEARRLDGLAIVAPEDDADDARALAAAAGGICVTVAGPSSVPAALAALVPA